MPTYEMPTYRPTGKGIATGLTIHMYDNQTFVCFDDGTSWPFKDGYRLMSELGSMLADMHKESKAHERSLVAQEQLTGV